MKRATRRSHFFSRVILTWLVLNAAVSKTEFGFWVPKKKKKLIKGGARHASLHVERARTTRAGLHVGMHVVSRGFSWHARKRRRETYFLGHHRLPPVGTDIAMLLLRASEVCV